MLSGSSTGDSQTDFLELSFFGFAKILAKRGHFFGEIRDQDQRRPPEAKTRSKSQNVLTKYQRSRLETESRTKMGQINLDAKMRQPINPTLK